MELALPDEATVADLGGLIFEKTRIPQGRQTLMIPGAKITKNMLESGTEAITSLFKSAAVKGTLIGTPVGEEFKLRGAAGGASASTSVLTSASASAAASASSSAAASGSVSIPHVDNNGQEMDDDDDDEDEMSDDLSEDEKPMKWPHGYINVGNTCYLGSVLTMLENIEPFKNQVILNQGADLASGAGGNVGNIGGDTADSGSRNLIQKWTDLWRAKPLERPASPMQLFTAFGTLHPDFAAIKPGSLVAQMQDSEECLFKLLNSLPPKAVAAWKTLFDFQLEETEMLADAGDQMVESNDCKKEEGKAPGEDRKPIGEKSEAHKIVQASKLACYMGSVGKAIGFMNAGIELGLSEEVTKFAPELARDAVYKRRRLIASLPDFLIVHMVRFEWKRAGAKSGRAKILRRVEYPTTLDLYSFCTDALKRRLNVGRDADQRHREAELEAARAAFADPTPSPSASKTALASGSGSGGASGTVSGAAQTSIDALSPPSKQKRIETKSARALAEELEARKTTADGSYKLRGVVTHIGRGVDEGHYIYWLFRDDYWLKVNDAETTAVPLNAIDLQGGLADGHSPYILLYQRIGKVSDDELDPSAQSAPKIEAKTED